MARQPARHPRVGKPERQLRAVLQAVLAVLCRRLVPCLPAVAGRRALYARGQRPGGAPRWAFRADRAEATFAAGSLLTGRQRETRFGLTRAEATPGTSTRARRIQRVRAAQDRWATSDSGRLEARCTTRLSAARDGSRLPGGRRASDVGQDYRFMAIYAAWPVRSGSFISAMACSAAAASASATFRRSRR